MEKQNDIENLFKEKLDKLEADPGKDAWSNIKAGLGAAATGTVATQAISSGSWTSSIIAGAVITATALGGYFFFNEQGEKQKKNATKVEEVILENSDASPSIEQNTGTPSEQITETTEKASEVVIDSKEEEKQVIHFIKKDQPNKKDKTFIDEKALTSDEDLDKTIDEIIAESQAQFEANQLEAMKLEEAQKTPSSNQETTAQSDETTADQSINSKDQSEIKKSNYYNVANDIEFPNAFTPDLDGTNDIFLLGDQYHDKIDNITVYIYSNSNKVIYDWKGLNGSWNGNFRSGSLAPVGTYFYYAIIVKDNMEYYKKGSFSLKR